VSIVPQVHGTTKLVLARRLLAGSAPRAHGAGSEEPVRTALVLLVPLASTSLQRDRLTKRVACSVLQALTAQFQAPQPVPSALPVHGAATLTPRLATCALRVSGLFMLVRGDRAIAHHVQEQGACGMEARALPWRSQTLHCRLCQLRSKWNCAPHMPETFPRLVESMTSQLLTLRGKTRQSASGKMEPSAPLSYRSVMASPQTCLQRDCIPQPSGVCLRTPHLISEVRRWVLALARSA